LIQSGSIGKDIDRLPVEFEAVCIFMNFNKKAAGFIDNLTKISGLSG
jgi:hypothetical protein